MSDQNSGGFLQTSSTALAAALNALGFQMLKARALIRTYTEKRPKGTLGVWVYRIEPDSPTVYCKSATWAMAQWHLADALHKQRTRPTAKLCSDEIELIKQSGGITADQTLDETILDCGKDLDAAVMNLSADPAGASLRLRSAQKKLAKVRELLPGAYLAVCAQAEGNRIDITTKLMELAKTDEDCPWTRVDHDGGRYTLVPYNFPREETAALIASARRK